jgi:hypothetical protein
MNTLRFALTILTTILIGYISGNAQVNKQTSDFEEIAVVQEQKFYVNAKEAIRTKGDAVTFEGMRVDMRSINANGEPDVFDIITFGANCKTKEYTAIAKRGIDRGKVIDGMFEANKQEAKKDTVIWIAIEKACKASEKVLRA